MTAGPDAVRLRPMRWQDIPSLAALERLVFGDEAWSQETWWEELAGRPRRWYVVAAREVHRHLAPPGVPDVPGVPGGDGDGEIVGYAGLDLGGDTADVMTVAVSPQARGGGLGSRLVDALVAAAAGGGAAYLLLEVRADNLAARRLYERKGFCVLTTRARYYQPGDVDALVLRLTLTDAVA